MIDKWIDTKNLVANEEDIANAIKYGKKKTVTEMNDGRSFQFTFYIYEGCTYLADIKELLDDR